MKITINQLREIIREEIVKSVLSEGPIDKQWQAANGDKTKGVAFRNRKQNWVVAQSGGAGKPHTISQKGKPVGTFERDGKTYWVKLNNGTEYYADDIDGVLDMASTYLSRSK